MLPLCRAEGVGVIPWSPLARGFLAGNRTRPTAKRVDSGRETLRAATDDYARNLYYSESDFQVVERVVELASRRGVVPAQIALAWLMSKPAVSSPIVGMTKIEHLNAAIAALEIKLDSQECVWLEEPYVPHQILGLT